MKRRASASKGAVDAATTPTPAPAGRARGHGRRASAGAALALGGLLLAGHARAGGGDVDRAAAAPAQQTEAPAAPTWRFKKEDRPVKVVVLAGSIGAWPRSSYADRIQEMCSEVEVKNLSTVGMGAYALKRRFIEQVLRNWNLRWNDPLLEYWLVFQGGLNSVGTPEATNHHIRELFVKAHRRGLGVVGLSLTPWGDDSDRKRWRGIEGLTYLGHTQKVVDFVLGRSTPEDALGSYTRKRKRESTGFDADELADVRVDLYDSPLRDAAAPARDVTRMRDALDGSRAWQRAHADLDAYGRARALEADAQAAAEVPRWWLREDLRAFDHIHPNAEGHEIIAALLCPALPERWGCACPPLPGPPGVSAAGESVDTGASEGAVEGPPTTAATGAAGTAGTTGTTGTAGTAGNVTPLPDPDADARVDAGEPQ